MGVDGNKVSIDVEIDADIHGADGGGNKRKKGTGTLDDWSDDKPAGGRRPRTGGRRRPVGSREFSIGYPQDPSIQEGADDLNAGILGRDRAVLARMSPMAFLKSTDYHTYARYRHLGLHPGEAVDRELIDRYKKSMSAGSKFPAPFIFFDPAKGRSLMHDGRHRAIAAHELGISKMPVWLQSSTPMSAAERKKYGQAAELKPHAGAGYLTKKQSDAEIARLLSFRQRAMEKALGSMGAGNLPATQPHLPPAKKIHHLFARSIRQKDGGTEAPPGDDRFSEAYKDFLILERSINAEYLEGGRPPISVDERTMDLYHGGFATLGGHNKHMGGHQFRPEHHKMMAPQGSRSSKQEIRRKAAGPPPFAAMVAARRQYRIDLKIIRQAERIRNREHLAAMKASGKMMDAAELERQEYIRTAHTRMGPVPLAESTIAGGFGGMGGGYRFKPEHHKMMAPQGSRSSKQEIRRKAAGPPPFAAMVDARAAYRIQERINRSAAAAADRAELHAMSASSSMFGRAERAYEKAVVRTLKKQHVAKPFADRIASRFTNLFYQSMRGGAQIQSAEHLIGTNIFRHIAKTGVWGSLIVATVTAVIATPKVIAEFVKLASQKGLPSNDDWHRSIETEVDALFDIEDKKRRLLGIDGYVVTQTDRYSPESGTVSYNSFENRMETVVSKSIGLAEKAVGIE